MRCFTCSFATSTVVGTVPVLVVQPEEGGVPCRHTGRCGASQRISVASTNIAAARTRPEGIRAVVLEASTCVPHGLRQLAAAAALPGTSEMRGSLSTIPAPKSTFVFDPNRHCKAPSEVIRR